MNNLPNESVLAEHTLGTGRLVLTTHRVRHLTRSLGYDSTKSIMLEELAFAGTTFSTHPLLLVIGAVCAIGGAIAWGNVSHPDFLPLVGGILAGGVFVLLYFLSRQRVILLASAGGAIRAFPRGMNGKAVGQFLDRTEAAKNDRYLLHYQVQAAGPYYQANDS